MPQHQTLAVAEGDDLVVSCQATGSPVPVIEWRRQMDGKVIGNLSEVSGDLVIPGIKRTDAGAYICTADNHHAKAFTVTKIIVECKEALRNACDKVIVSII